MKTIRGQYSDNILLWNKENLFIDGEIRENIPKYKHVMMKVVEKIVGLGHDTESKRLKAISDLLEIQSFGGVNGISSTQYEKMEMYIREHEIEMDKLENDPESFKKALCEDFRLISAILTKQLELNQVNHDNFKSTRGNMDEDMDEDEIREYLIEKHNKGLRSAFDNVDKNNGYRDQMIQQMEQKRNEQNDSQKPKKHTTERVERPSREGRKRKKTGKNWVRPDYGGEVRDKDETGSDDDNNKP
jgi:hypothetical protein